MARSKGQCHSLTIKLGYLKKGHLEVLRKVKRGAEFDNARWVVQVEAMQKTIGERDKVISELKGRLNDVCGLRDIIVRYDDLVLASRYNSSMPAPIATCLETLRKSLFEAAEGCGVKRA